MWFTDTSIVCETGGQSFTEAPLKQNLSSVWPSSSRLWRNDTPPYLSRLSASGRLGTVNLEAERLSGLLGHSNVKCKGMKHWWPSSPFSCKRRRNIKLSFKYMLQRWLYLFLFCLNIPRKTLLLLKRGRPCAERFCTFVKDCVREIEQWVTGAIPSFCAPKDFCTVHNLPPKA